MRYWYFGYLILLLGGIFYINAILKRDAIIVGKELPEKEATLEKLVDVDVIVNNGKNIKIYETKLKNIDTVYDVFDEIRDQDDFFYQISGYLYGIELDCVNDTCGTDGYKWIAYKDDVDITKNLKDTSLDKDTVIKLVLTRN
jgi:hypothetical protein